MMNKYNLLKYLEIIELRNKSKYILEEYGIYSVDSDEGNLYLNRDFSKPKPYVTAHLGTIDEQNEPKTLCFQDNGNAFPNIVFPKRNEKQCNNIEGVDVGIALALFEELDIGVCICNEQKGVQIHNKNVSYIFHIRRPNPADEYLNLNEVFECYNLMKSALLKLRNEVHR
jgi:hypothetical protein